MYVDWIFIIILIVLFAALIREVVKADRRAKEYAIENQVLLVKIDGLERSYAATARQLREQGVKIDRVQAAINKIERHPDSIVANLCKLGVYMQRFYETTDYFDLQ